VQHVDLIALVFERPHNPITRSVGADDQVGALQLEGRRAGGDRRREDFSVRHPEDSDYIAGSGVIEITVEKSRRSVLDVLKSIWDFLVYFVGSGVELAHIVSVRKIDGFIFAGTNHQIPRDTLGIHHVGQHHNASRAQVEVISVLQIDVMHREIVCDPVGAAGDGHLEHGIPIVLQGGKTARIELGVKCSVGNQHIDGAIGTDCGTRARHPDRFPSRS